MIESVAVEPVSRRTPKANQNSLSESARRRMLDHERGGLIRADWLNMVFLHLEVDPALLQKQTPFELDLFEGRAFISLVAFVMRRFRIRGSGSVGSWLCAPVARHGFLNVRTYVRHRDEPGIYFLSEFVSNPLSVVFGPRTYGLPYRVGRLQYKHDFDNRHWQGTVHSRGRHAAIEYHAISAETDTAKVAEPGSLNAFLLERYTAYTRRHGASHRFRIWHEPWLATEIDATIERNDLLGLIEPDLRDAALVAAHASRGVRDVWIGLPQRC